jgi:hypothetical protein
MGIISRGLETEERTGPTFAAWIVGALNRKLEVPCRLVSMVMRFTSWTFPSNSFALRVETRSAWLTRTGLCTEFGSIVSTRGGPAHASNHRTITSPASGPSNTP